MHRIVREGTQNHNAVTPLRIELPAWREERTNQGISSLTGEPLTNSRTTYS